MHYDLPRFSLNSDNRRH